METEEDLSETLKNTFYLDRNLVSSKTLKLMDNNLVKVTQLHEIKLKPRVSKKQEIDMLDMKKKIVEHENFIWKNEQDAGGAKENNLNAKINECVFYNRCIKRRVVIYDTKDKGQSEIQTMLRNKNLICIGVENAGEGICKNKRDTFEKSKWIEIIDSRLNRGSAKKFPLLNSALFTKTNPDGEVQGQTILGKYTTHEYRCTDKSYKSDENKSAAQRLQEKIFGFFTHYRSDEAQEKYEMLKFTQFQEEFQKFENYIKAYWKLKTCERFCLSIRTNSVESFFATRLFYVPKNTKFPKSYSVKIKICALRWNEKHISDCYKKIHGDTGVNYRKNWHRKIHQKVIQDYATHKYVEKRGRKRKLNEL